MLLYLGRTTFHTGRRSRFGPLKYEVTLLTKRVTHDPEHLVGILYRTREAAAIPSTANPYPVFNPNRPLPNLTLT